MNVTVIIPAYNEAGAIGPTIEKIISLYPDYEVLVVDDGSTDDTSLVARAAGARVHQHPYNIGNGASIKSGVRHATHDVVVMMDGDGQHRPEDIAILVEGLKNYDLVVGARNSSGQASMHRHLANSIYNKLASYVSQFPIQDLTSGFRAFHRMTIIQYLTIFPNRFSYPTTSTLAYLRSGLTVHYVPIDVRKRVGSSKIKIVRDGLRFLLIIMRIATLYSPLRVFMPISMAFLITGIVYYSYTFILFGRFTNMSALMISVSVMVFLLGMVSEQITQLRYDRVI